MITLQKFEKIIFWINIISMKFSKVYANQQVVIKREMHDFRFFKCWYTSYCGYLDLGAWLKHHFMLNPRPNDFFTWYEGTAWFVCYEKALFWFDRLEIAHWSHKEIMGSRSHKQERQAVSRMNLIIGGNVREESMRRHIHRHNDFKHFEHLYWQFCFALRVLGNALNQYEFVHTPIHNCVQQACIDLRDQDTLECKVSPFKKVFLKWPELSYSPLFV